MLGLSMAGQAQADHADGRSHSLQPTAKKSWTALLLAPAAVHGSPGGRVRSHLGTASLWDKGPVQLMVLDNKMIGNTEWLQVRLPTRPNSSRGWIDANYARLHVDPWRVDVSRSKKRLSVYRAGRRVRTFKVVVGKPSTPTPSGLFAIYEKIPQHPITEFEGAEVLTLTAHSNKLKHFEGGPGRVAIHGRAGASLYDPLGTARSHGCIRVSNHPVRWIAHHLPLGTSVRVY